MAISKAEFRRPPMSASVRVSPRLRAPRLELFAIAADVANPLRKGSDVAVSFDPAGLVLIAPD